MKNRVKELREKENLTQKNWEKRFMFQDRQSTLLKPENMTRHFGWLMILHNCFI